MNLGYNISMIKKIVIALFLIVLVVASAFGFFQYQRYVKIRNVKSFEDCTTVADPLKSYPPRCNTPDGRTFKQNVGNELEMIDEIMVTNPRPNQTIANPISVQGRARGSWFFEGSLSGELVDDNNKKIGLVILTAEGEWMTDEFVHFQGELSFNKPEKGHGTLFIHKENPSGLPENDKKLTIPVKF